MSSSSVLNGAYSRTANYRDAGVYAVKVVLEKIERALMRNPASALETVIVGSRKPALRIDLNAEFIIEDAIREWDEDNGHSLELMEVLGEESLRDPTLNLMGKEGVYALVDAIDGTDLLERGLGNWCTTGVFFRPNDIEAKRILAAFVGLPTGEIYYATADDNNASVIRSEEDPPTGVSGSSGVTSVRDASVCFYGQKSERLLATTARPLFKAGGTNPFRVYNLAGIPMMMRLIDYRFKTAHGIDSVFEIMGQKPHDVVPGAYIAMKGGAVVKDLSGRPLSEVDLENALLRPAVEDESEQLKYVIAATEQLCDEMISLL
jgi:fructose-1,6-bisphosphatase/inositol monophosphatase family enzyme